MQCGMAWPAAPAAQLDRGSPVRRAHGKGAWRSGRMMAATTALGRRQQPTNQQQTDQSATQGGFVGKGRRLALFAPHTCGPLSWPR